MNYTSVDTVMKKYEKYRLDTDMEKNFDAKGFMQWMEKNWSLSLYAVALYLLLIYFGRKFMEKRERFELNRPLFLWNLLLATYSIWAVLKAFPQLFVAITEIDFTYSICDATLNYDYGPNSFWAYLFVWSKIVELGDTAFIVLRKQNLLFLHWYHHITVLLYVWYSTANRLAAARYFAAVNCFIHSMMYTYFTFKSLNYKVPKWVSIFITSFQIVQMGVGIFITWSVYDVLASGGKCDATFGNIYAGCIMYLSYFILFLIFFWQAYILKKPTNVMKKIL